MICKIIERFFKQNYFSYLSHLRINFFLISSTFRNNIFFRCNIFLSCTQNPYLLFFFVLFEEILICPQGKYNVTKMQLKIYQKSKIKNQKSLTAPPILRMFFRCKMFGFSIKKKKKTLVISNLCFICSLQMITKNHDP